MWPDKYDLAIANLDGPHTYQNKKTGQLQSFNPVTGHRMPLRQMLEAEYSSDAHMTCYAVKWKDGTTSDIPLMKKQSKVLSQIRKEGGDFLTTCIAFDWDCPGHAKLSEEFLKDFLTKFLTAGAADDRLDTWTCVYTTRHGVRIIYDLVEPLPVDNAEKRYISMIKEFKRHGLLMDAACKDWTRRFRLPKVVRDRILTKEEALFDIQFQDKKLDMTLFKKADLKSLAVALDYKRSVSSPTPEQCYSYLFEEGANGREVMSAFHKKAKAMLKASTPYGDQIFNDSIPLCGDTGRNEAFQTILGLVVPKMIERFKASPEKIFSLFSGPLDALEIIPGKQNPKDHFWNFLHDIYEREYAKYIDQEEVKAEAVEAGQNALERMVEGMKQWCSHSDLFSDDNLVREAFVRSHIFANISKFYYPMGKDGWYSSMCLTKDQLVPRIRKSFLKDIVETNKLDMRGEPTSVSPVEISNNYATVVNEVRMSPLQGSKGRIDDVDGDSPILMLPMYQRNDFLPAVYNGAVDGWLKALFGKNYAAASKWIGYALAFEEGSICALSISGYGSVGKKMFSEGLAECLIDPCTATGHDMCGHENGAILKTPFLVVNEGMPRSRDMSPSDTFKSLTAGDPIRVRELYKPPVNVINPMRLIFTANDHAVLQSISKGKELTPQTRKAMGERLLHFDVGSDAETYLSKLGGRAYTEKEGARWIRGDSGQPSDYIVAKHFMWLYKNRPPRNQLERYCVMGNCDESESFQIASQSEYLPMVMRGIIGMVEVATSQLNKKHVHLSSDGGVFVTIQGVFAQIRDVNQERVSERAMEGVLKSLMLDNTLYEKNGMYFKRLNPGAIVDWAKPNGWPCPKIEHAWNVSREKLSQK
jgi:hypothetical protein